MYKAELYGGERDGEIVNIPDSSQERIHYPRLSPVKFNHDETIAAGTRVEIDVYHRHAFTADNRSITYKWVLNGVSVL